MDPKDRIELLSRQLLHHQYLYYVKAEPEISDREYDRLFDELLALEKQYPQLALDNSPTKRIGSDLDNSFPERDHAVPVLSLDKVYDTDHLLEWVDKVTRTTDSSPGIVVEDKIDGASIVLYYRQGALETALTRGNGFQGNDVTENVRTIKQVPLLLNETANLAVRGEIFITKTDFEVFNKELADRYANPRNLAAGSLRNVRSAVTARVPLQFRAHEGYFLNPDMKPCEQPADHLVILSTLRDLGLRISSPVMLFVKKSEPEAAHVPASLGIEVASFDDLARAIESRRGKRASTEYEMDGLVIKVNETRIRDRLGETSHHPRWAIAFKFDAPLAETVLRSIQIQIGRNGRVTPVAQLDPVRIAGSSVARATLHNQEYIDILELGPGDRVSISRRGDVIPAVEEVVEKSRDDPTIYRLPSRCPFCNSKLVREGGHHFCRNVECPERRKRRLIHFAGKEGMDIDGLGEKTLTLMFERGFVRDCPDIYFFDYRRLLREEGFKDRKIDNIVRGVEDSRNQPFRRVLIALGFEGLGRSMAEDLIAHGFDSMDSLLAVAREGDIEELSSVEGIGELSAALLVRQFSDPDNVAMIERLREAGLNFRASGAADRQTDRRFQGQVWVITGSFDHFSPRSRAADEIRRRGGEVTTTVSGRTTHLLCGESPGSKLEKARSLGARVVREDEFLALLK